MIWIWWRGGQTDMWWGGIDESRKEWGEWEAWTPVSIYLSTPPSLTLTPYTIIHYQASLLHTPPLLWATATTTHTY